MLATHNFSDVNVAEAEVSGKFAEAYAALGSKIDDLFGPVDGLTGRR